MLFRSDLPSMERLVHLFEGQIIETTYLSSVSMTVAVRESKLEPFLAAVMDTFYGQVRIESIEGISTPS